MYFLFQIPNPIYWTTNQVANIISFFSAVGTVGALLYAFYLQRKNSKKINDLAEITIKLAEQNELIAEQNRLQKLAMKEEVRPDFVRGGSGSNGTSGEMTFYLMNHGNKAIVTNIEYKEDDVTLQKKTMPLTIKKEKEIRFEATSRGEKHINNCNWEVILYYHDIYSNSYTLVIMGTGKDILKFGIKED